MLYIHPRSVSTAGPCEPACPVEAIYHENDLPDRWRLMPKRTRGSLPSRSPVGTRLSAPPAGLSAGCRGRRHINDRQHSARLDAVAAWRETPFFTRREQTVLAWCEA